MSSRLRLMDSASLRRRNRSAKSGSLGRDRPEVLGPVQLPLGVLVVAVEADGDLAAAEVLGEGVVVVPAVGAGLVGAADGVGRWSSSKWCSPSSVSRPMPRAPARA